MPDFYEVGPIRQVAINLFYGWGYNFYRKENQLRQDDQTIRSKAVWLLGQARAAVEAAESEFCRAHMPAPTRAAPYPDPAAVSGAQTLERLSGAIGALAGQITAQPVPENDRMTQRYRKEAQTLENLGLCDQDLIGRAELIRSLVTANGGEALIEQSAEIVKGLDAIRATLLQRAEILL